MKKYLVLAGFCAAVGLSGCVGRASVGVNDPNLVYIEPGVYVVAESDRPTFYSDGSYWLYDGGVWYSSNVRHGNWVVTRRVPPRVYGIRNPRSYVHYRRRPVNTRDYRAPVRRGEVRREVRRGEVKRGNVRRENVKRENVKVYDYRKGDGKAEERERRPEPHD